MRLSAIRFKPGVLEQAISWPALVEFLQFHGAEYLDCGLIAEQRIGAPVFDGDIDDAMRRRSRARRRWFPEPAAAAPKLKRKRWAAS